LRLATFSLPYVLIAQRDTIAETFCAYGCIRSLSTMHCRVAQSQVPSIQKGLCSCEREVVMAALFRDRRDAGEKLARKLAAYVDRPDVLVLALQRSSVYHNPAAINLRRVSSCSVWFICRIRTVTLPTGVLPTISSSTSSKCSSHESDRGLNRGVSWPLTPSYEAISLPLAMLHRKQAHARLLSSDEPPCFRATMCST
jgi:hypothetical protein